MPVGRPLLEGLTKRASNIHYRILVFWMWVERLNLAKPMQLLNLRFERVKPWDLEGDSLPAVRNSERCLSSLNPTFRSYYLANRRLARAKYQLKVVLKSRGKEIRILILYLFTAMNGDPRFPLDS